MKDKRTTISLDPAQVRVLANLARSMDLDQSKVIRLHLDACADIASLSSSKPELFDQVRPLVKPSTFFLLDSYSRIDK